MRLASIGSEAWRNVRCGASHVATWTAVLVALIGGLAVTEAIVVRGLVEQAERFQAAGANVTTFVANGAIDGGTCQALTAVPGVQISGALRSTARPLALGALPSGPIPAFEVTPGFAGLLGVAATDAGVLIPLDVAQTLDVGPGSEVLTADGRVVHIAATFPFPSDGRATDLQNAILEPVSGTGTFDQCWVRTWPDNANIVALSRMVLIADAPDGTTVSTGLLNPTLGSAFDGADRFAHRTTALAWAVAVAVGIVAGLAAIYLRRRHLAEARHAGVGMAAQLLQVMLETCAVLLAVVPISSLACALAAPAEDSRAVWALGARVILVGSAATLFGAAIGVTTIRKRLLIRYVKD